MGHKLLFNNSINDGGGGEKTWVTIPINGSNILEPIVLNSSPIEINKIYAEFKYSVTATTYFKLYIKESVSGKILTKTFQATISASREYYFRIYSTDGAYMLVDVFQDSFEGLLRLSKGKISSSEYLELTGIDKMEKLEQYK